MGRVKKNFSRGGAETRREEISRGGAEKKEEARRRGFVSARSALPFDLKLWTLRVVRNRSPSASPLSSPRLRVNELLPSSASPRLRVTIMPDLLLELLSEEIPARMQAKAREDLARLLADQLAVAGLKAEAIETWSTPRRLALIARGLPLGTPAVSEELKGPAPVRPRRRWRGSCARPALPPDQLEDRNGIWFAVVNKPGRATTEVLAEAIPAIVRAFPWPKSMRWGAASLSTESLRWVRPLQGIVAMLDEEVIDVRDRRRALSGAATRRPPLPSSRPRSPLAARRTISRSCAPATSSSTRTNARASSATARRRWRPRPGWRWSPDEGLVEENAGLTEWPVPLLGRFDPAFLEVPREVIQLTMRTNQKYFVCRERRGEARQRLRLRRQHRRERRRRADRRGQPEGAGRAAVATRASSGTGLGAAGGAGGEARADRLPRKARHRRRQGRARGQARALAGGGGDRQRPSPPCGGGWLAGRGGVRPARLPSQPRGSSLQPPTRRPPPLPQAGGGASPTSPNAPRGSARPTSSPRWSASSPSCRA